MNQLERDLLELNICIIFLHTYDLSVNNLVYTPCCMLYFYFYKLFTDENKKKEQLPVLANSLNHQVQPTGSIGLCSIVHRLWRRRSGVFLLRAVKSLKSLSHLTLSIISTNLTKHFNVSTFRQLALYDAQHTVLDQTAFS